MLRRGWCPYNGYRRGSHLNIAVNGFSDITTRPHLAHNLNSPVAINNGTSSIIADAMFTKRGSLSYDLQATEPPKGCPRGRGMQGRKFSMRLRRIFS